MFILSYKITVDQDQTYAFLIFTTCFKFSSTLTAIAVTEEFGYDITYGSEETRKDVESAIAVQLVRKLRDSQTGLVQLVFSVIYAPYKIMK